MSRPILLLALAPAMLAVASGAALALTRDWEPLRDSFGSNRSDTMRGSRGTDYMFGLAGNDTMKRVTPRARYGRGGPFMPFASSGAWREP